MRYQRGERKFHLARFEESRHENGTSLPQYQVTDIHEDIFCNERAAERRKTQRERSAGEGSNGQYVASHQRGGGKRVENQTHLIVRFGKSRLVSLTNGAKIESSSVEHV